MYFEVNSTVKNEPHQFLGCNCGKTLNFVLISLLLYIWTRKICDRVEFDFDFAVLNLSSSMSEAYLGPNQTSMLKLFARIINGEKLFFSFCKVPPYIFNRVLFMYFHENCMPSFLLV